MTKQQLEEKIRSLELELILERVATEEAMDDASDHLVANQILDGFNTGNALIQFIESKFEITKKEI